MKGHFEGQNVDLAEDFVATYELDPSEGDNLQLLTYRNPDPVQPPPTETAPARRASNPGFFEAQALIGLGKNRPSFSASLPQRYTEDGDRTIRYVPVYAVGKAGAQLSGSRNLAAYVEAPGSFQPRPF